jgi:hypothetical protein
VADNLTEEWMTEEPANPTNDNVDLEIEAMRSVYTALKGLDAPAQNRVLDYVLRRLSLKRKAVTDSRDRQSQEKVADLNRGSTANPAAQRKAKRPSRQP